MISKNYLCLYSINGVFLAILNRKDSPYRVK